MIEKDNPFYNYITYANELLIFVFILFLISLFFDLQRLQNVSILLFLFILFFFRNISNNFNKNDNNLIASTSGTVESIEEFDNYNKISIYLSPFDTHYVVSPSTSKIINIFDLNKDNEERTRLELNNHILLDYAVLNNQLTKIFIDKRVIINSNIGDNINQGERIGMIRFGSQMTYYIPKKYKIKVKKNEYLKVSNSIIASI